MNKSIFKVMLIALAVVDVLSLVSSVALYLLAIKNLLLLGEWYVVIVFSVVAVNMAVALIILSALVINNIKIGKVKK